MAIRVAINGYGRIGRNVLRALYESDQYNDLAIVAINDPGDIEINAHLTRVDTAQGPFPGEVAVDGDALVVNGDPIRVTGERDATRLPWGELDIDVVLECTGRFTQAEDARIHLAAGAKKVLISAPGKGDVDATVCYGVNHELLSSDMTVVSNASCTTNCLAPLVHAVNASVGVQSGQMTTVHSYTNDQKLTDVHHKDPRRARSATHSMIPTSTGAAKAVGLVLPELAGRLQGYSVRVPTINVSLVDFSFIARRTTSVEEINEALKAATAQAPAGVLACNEEPLVSIDFNHTAESSIFDLTQTLVTDGTLVKVAAWYDNEWGFSHRMLDVARTWLQA